MTVANTARVSHVAAGGPTGPTGAPRQTAGIAGRLAFSVGQVVILAGESVSSANRARPPDHNSSNYYQTIS